MREDSTVGVKIAELLRLNVSTLIDEQFSVKVQKTAQVPQAQLIDKLGDVLVDMPRHVSAVQVAQKTAEISQVQFIDRVVSPLVVQQIQYQRCRRSRKSIVQITQMQFLDKVIVIPVVVQRQVSMVQVVQKTVGHEERQRVRDCNRKSCDVTVDIDADTAYSHRERCVCYCPCCRCELRRRILAAIDCRR